MQSNTQTASPWWMPWAGYVVSALPALILLMSGIGKLVTPTETLKEQIAPIGWDVSLMLWLGILEVGCTIIYVIPRTSVLGAILLTGYMGGAIATHVRIFEPFALQLLIGVFVWLGLYLRDARLRALLPLRS
jgi:hypothetical protein